MVRKAELARIRRWRRRLGVSLRQLSEDLHVDESTISRWFARGAMKRYQLEAIEAALRKRETPAA